MAVTVRTARKTIDGDVTETFENGYGFYVNDGHLFVTDGPGNAVATYAPGQWVDAAVAKS